jgi:hypothetical protein
LQFEEQKNGGVVVLAYLYQRLDEACQELTRSIGGLWLLLMLWSWTRLPSSRPLSSETTIFNDWGTPDRDACAPFSRHNFNYKIK